MKTLLLIIAIGGMHCSLQAQTNTNAAAQTNATARTNTNKPPGAIKPASAPAPVVVPNFGQTRLTAISNRVAVLTKKAEELNARWAVEDKRLQLQMAAGQWQPDRARMIERERRQNSFYNEIAVLNLEAFEVRQRYKIPEPQQPETKKRKGAR